MALHFDGSSYIEFPNIRHTSVSPACCVVALHKPTAGSSLNQYLLSMSNEAEDDVGGISFCIAANDTDFRVFVGRDSYKNNTTTSSAVKWGQWQMTAVVYNGNINDPEQPRMMNVEFPNNSASASYLADDNTAGSGDYIPGAGRWAIGSLAFTGTNIYGGDIEYIAYYEDVGYPIWLISSLGSGASPLKFAQNKLKFFVRLNDPKNVIDIVSGRKGGIVGTLTESTEHPRISY